MYLQSHTCGHWHTQRLECSPLLPTPISAVLTPTSGTPRPAPRFYLPIWTFPFQVDVQVLGVPGVDFVPLANSPASLRALLLVHAGCATLILVRVRLGPGGAASKGRPRPEGHPPPPPATPGSTFLVLPEPAWAGPVTPCPGCPGLSPMQGTGPWGPPFQVHVHPYSSGHPRSVCAPFWSFLIMELKPAGRRLGPWLHQAAGEVEASLVNNSEKQLEAARSPCAYVNSGASSKGHSLQAVLYWACQG